MSDKESLTLENLKLTKEQKEQVNEIISHTRDRLATTKEELIPMCHLFDGPKSMKLLVTPFTEPGSKEAIANMIRKEVRTNQKTHLLVYALESFCLKFKGEDETKQFQKERRQGKWKSFGDHPAAMEIMMFLVETRQHSWSGVAEISKRDKKGFRTMTEPQFSDGATGIFVNILRETPPPLNEDVEI